MHERTTRVTHCEVTAGNGRITLVRELQAPGMIHLTQKLTFSAHDPVIRLDLEMELLPEPSPQPLYFVFPLEMTAGWQALYDTAGPALLRTAAQTFRQAPLIWPVTCGGQAAEHGDLKFKIRNSKFKI